MSQPGSSSGGETSGGSASRKKESELGANPAIAGAVAANPVAAGTAAGDPVENAVVEKILDQGDTDNDPPHFFEGAEKRIYILFTREDGTDWRQGCDLRQIPRHSLETILGTVNCHIISSISNTEIDSYVLSESSLFVGKRDLILKTCGTTTPLHCLPYLWTLVKEHTKFDTVESLYYSHKNFLRPELQKLPYQKFGDEINILDTFLNESEASSNYVLGSLNRERYYLYNFDANLPNKRFGPVPEQTLEVIMSELDPNVMKIFTQKESTDGSMATLKSGIHKLISGMRIDDFLFQPCGYSMNGIRKDGSYMTIHVTPEPDFSFVSFETNISVESYKEVVGRVVKLFNPRAFMLTLLSDKSTAHEELSEMDIVEARWIRNESQFNRLNWSDITYGTYEKIGKGSA